VTTAGLAPSIHNSQPWRWRVRQARADLYAERRRQLPVTDPDGRLLALSCGAALHHARVALAAEGWAARTTLLPNPDDPDLLARIDIEHRAEPSTDATRLVQTMRMRHTDRRPVTDTPVPDQSLERIVRAAQSEGVQVHLLRPDQLVELAAVAGYAQKVEKADAAWIAELSYWTGGDRPDQTGIPDTAIPAHTAQTTVPARDFGHHGTMPISAEHDRAAVFAVVYGDEDNSIAWLRAGQALSAAWLQAIELGVSVVPLSAPVEVVLTRQALHRLLAGFGEPYLVIRLGIPDSEHPGPVHTPRLDPAETTQVQRD
jgi:nitroreductase